MALDELAVLDGTVLPADEATIGVTDLGLIRGDGVFEVISLHDGRMFALEDHLRRMATSAQNLRLEIDLNAVRADIETLAAAAGPVTGALRFMVTRGGRRIGLVEPERGEDPPLRLATVEYVPTRILDGIKSWSYGANMLATRIALERGGTEALLVTPHGRVLEAPTSAFFVSFDGETLVTPPLDDHILDSITRRRLLGLLPHAREEVVTQESLGSAREAFLASTTREVQPVVAIDGAALPAAPGPLTAAAGEAFAVHLAGELG
ncbi:MAG TPA: aminotransferase class IV [Baekduia sp.]